MIEKLAIHGGTKAVNYDLPVYNHIGEEELTAVVEVLKSGKLSNYVGSWEPAFYGGPKVQEFERNWANEFEVKHAIAVNSWTSGLMCAIGSIGVEPGDEIIVSPWTMSASATSILHWNAIPVFADISSSDFCLDPEDVIRKISPRTRAILAVDIFGQSCRVETLMKIAEEANIYLILDSAQSPGATRNGKFAGTQAHIGGFSLNHHKHIHTGEGGMIVTNDDLLAEKMRLIRNHAEAVVATRDWDDFSNMVGFNFRMGEIEAAIGIEQLKKLPSLLANRQEVANKLTDGMRDIPGVYVPEKSNSNSHVYYMFPFLLDLNALRGSRTEIFEALIAEGVQGLTAGYTNLHLLPMYQKKIAFGTKSFPWSLNPDVEYDYSMGTLPVAENLHHNSLLLLEICQYEYTNQDIMSTIYAIRKVLTYFSKGE